MRACFLPLILAASAACANGVQEMNDSLPTCSTLAECQAHDGKRVRVIATYTVWDPLPDRARNHPPAQQVMLKFGGDDGPFLEPWGHEGHMRSLDEIARFNGKRVRVTGTFLRAMPPHPTDPPHAASLGGPCVRSVERIEAVD